MAVIQERPDKESVIRPLHYNYPIKRDPTQTVTFKRKTDAKSTESAIREGRYFKTAEAKKHTLANLVDRYIKDILPKKKPEKGNRGWLFNSA